MTWRPSPFQKKLIQEPRNVQLEIERFLVELLNRAKLVGYEHFILRGVVHSLFVPKMTVKVEEYKENGETIRKISIDFLNGFIEIPVGNFISVKINLHITSRKEFPETVIPVDVALNYGVLSKRSGVISARIVGTAVFKVTNIERMIPKIKELAERIPAEFHIMTEDEEIRKRKEEE